VHKDLNLGELNEIYKGKGVPAHRSASLMYRNCSIILPHSGLAKPGAFGLIEGLELIFPTDDKYLKTNGDTSYEELKCVGFNPDQSSLVGVITVKSRYGYSGDLC
jgi:hypothetical protein